jgi:hypothetical protein
MCGTKETGATCRAVMTAAENDAGPAEAEPELLLHMVTELAIVYQVFLDKSSKVECLPNNVVWC